MIRSLFLLSILFATTTAWMNSHTARAEVSNPEVVAVYQSADQSDLFFVLRKGILLKNDRKNPWAKISAGVMGFELLMGPKAAMARIDVLNEERYRGSGTGYLLENGGELRDGHKRAPTFYSPDSKDETKRVPLIDITNRAFEISREE